MLTEFPGNHEEYKEAQLSTQWDNPNTVGAIQLKAPSWGSFHVVMESHLYNGHFLLTYYSGDRENTEMSCQGGKLLNYQVVTSEKQCLQ